MLKLKFPDMNVRELFAGNWRQIDWRRTVLLVLLILAIAAIVWQRVNPQIRTVTRWQFHPVPVIKEVEKIKRVHVPCPEQGLVVLDKQEVAKKLDLDWLQGGDIAAARVGDSVGAPGALEPRTSDLGPASPPVAGNPADLQVTATAQLPESDNGYRVVTVINTATGVTTPVVREQEAPWFQFRNDAAMGVRYGLCAGTNTPWCGDVYGRWDFLRVKNIYLSASGDLSSEAEAKIQFGAEYRW